MTLTQHPTVVKLSSTPDIVAALPTFLGFHATESLVVLCLHGARRRSGLIMRADLPDPARHAAYAQETARRVVRQRASAVIVACYTSEPDASGRLPRGGLVDRLLGEFRDHEIDCVEALLVRDGRWWSYTCTGPCCPGAGTPLPDTPSDPIIQLEADRALAGQAVLPGRKALEESVEGPRATRLTELRRRFAETDDHLVEDVRRDGPVAVQAETVRLAHRMLNTFVAEGQAAIDDAEAVRLLAGLADKRPRDALLPWGLDGTGAQVLAFLTALAQRAPDEHAAPICTVLATVAYQHGNGALAGVALERALRGDPEYELAMLVDLLLQEHIPPTEIRAVARRIRRQLPELSFPGAAGPIRSGAGEDIVGSRSDHAERPPDDV